MLNPGTGGLAGFPGRFMPGMARNYGGGSQRQMSQNTKPSVKYTFPDSPIDQALKALQDGKLKEFLEISRQVKFKNIGGGDEIHEFFWDSLAPFENGGGKMLDEESDLFLVADGRQELGSLSVFPPTRAGNMI